MPVLSNNGRLISSLPVASSIMGGDEFLLQSNGVTKRISYASLSGSILSSNNFNPFNKTVNFTSTNNKFTGSFYNPDFKSSNFYTVAVRNTLTGNTIIATSGFSGNLSGNVTGNITGNVSGNVTGNVTGNITSTGTSTFSSIDVNGGVIDGTAIGASSATTVRGTTITATTGFSGNVTGNITGAVTGNVTGNVTGDLTGDVYNATTTKVLESGNTTPTANGGVSSAYFLGSSSYATQALTAAYAPAGAALNGLPSGGSRYQILGKNSATNYDADWVTPITRSGVPNSNYLTYWDNSTTLKDAEILYTSSPNVLTFNPGTLRVQNIEIIGNGSITGSYRGNPTDTETISSLNQGRFLNGVKYSTLILELSQSGNVTMSLLDGQTSTVLVKNSNTYTIQHWSGSLNGSTANTKIYWKSGVEPSVTSGNLKQDVFTFVNVNDRIYGSAIQNFS